MHHRLPLHRLLLLPLHRLLLLHLSLFATERDDMLVAPLTGVVWMD